MPSIPYKSTIETEGEIVLARAALKSRSIAASTNLSSSGIIFTYPVTGKPLITGKLTISYRCTQTGINLNKTGNFNLEFQYGSSLTATLNANRAEIPEAIPTIAVVSGQLQVTGNFSSVNSMLWLVTGTIEENV
ncbi:MAG: hypothetical protein ACRDBG_04630 [Waterburya sp.]